MKLKLDINKVEKYRVLYKFTKSDLAFKMKLTPAMITYLYKYQPVKMAALVAPIFDMDSKDFIIEVE